MTTRRLSILALVGFALGIAIVLPAIIIPPTVATASQFDNPEIVSRYASANVAAEVESKIQLINVLALPTTHGIGWLFMDVRSGKTYRIAVGDTLPIQFADGSTMVVAFKGVSSGFYFHPVYNSLRAPGVPLTPPSPPPPVGGSPIGGGAAGGGHYVYTGGPYYGPIGGDRSGTSCLSGNVADCPKDRGR
jgi:hypothetical protein